LSGPDPAVAAVRVAVRRALTESHPDRVLVACSGGADSLALAAAVAVEAPRLGVRAGLVTVERHGRFVHYAMDRPALSTLGSDLLAAVLR